MVTADQCGFAVLAVWCAAAEGGALFGGGSARLNVRSSTLQANTANTWGGGLSLDFAATGVLAGGVEVQGLCQNYGTPLVHLYQHPIDSVYSAVNSSPLVVNSSDLQAMMPGHGP
jgi:hypothetical protein